MISRLDFGGFDGRGKIQESGVMMKMDTFANKTKETRAHKSEKYIETKSEAMRFRSPKGTTSAWQGKEPKIGGEP